MKTPQNPNKKRTKKQQPAPKPFLSRKGKPRTYKQKRCDMVFNGSYIPKKAPIRVKDAAGKKYTIMVDTIASGIRKPDPPRSAGCLPLLIVGIIIITSLT